jgi:thymidylate synthase (FAD)
MGDDGRILEAARISYKSPSKGEEQDKKLLQYLWKNKHTSPFEMVKLTLNIKMPIFVMRQYVRHRMQNLNEVSARYTELPNEFYIPTVWRQQDVKNKQGSVVSHDTNPLMGCNGGNGDVIFATDAVRNHCEASYQLYQSLLDKGIAREMARMVLPVNIYTEIYACWDMKNLLHFITLRDDSHAQAEIQEYGKAIKAICRELFPWTVEAYEKYKWKLDVNE